MKSFNRTARRFLVLILMVSPAVASIAQGSQSSTPEERATRWSAWMKENLSLEPGQESPVYTINLKYAQLNETLRSSSSGRREKFQQLRSNDEQKDEELQKILTDTQFKTYQKKKKDFQKQMLDSMRK